jgi:hypothetical protein
MGDGFWCRTTKAVPAAWLPPFTKHVSPKNRMRSRPATRTASYAVPVLHCHRACGGMTPLARQHFAANSERHFCQGQLPSVILRSQVRNRRGGQRPCPLSRAGGEEAAMPGQPSTRSRAFPECPPAIHPRELPTAAGSAAIIQQNSGIHVFAEPTVRQFVAPRNIKYLPACAETVDEGTSLWKREEN